MKTLKECEKLTNPQLLAEIANRNTLIGIAPGASKSMQMKTEVEKLWKLMEKNGYKR